MGIFSFILSKHLPSSLDSSPLGETAPHQNCFQGSISVLRLSLLLGGDEHQLIWNHVTCESECDVSFRVELTQCLM